MYTTAVPDKHELHGSYAHMRHTHSVQNALTCILCDCRSCKSSKLCCWKIPQRIWQRLVRMTKPTSSSTLQRPMTGNCRDWAVMKWRIKMPGRFLLLQKAYSISRCVNVEIKMQMCSDTQTEKHFRCADTEVAKHICCQHPHAVYMLQAVTVTACFMSSHFACSSCTLL